MPSSIKVTAPDSARSRPLASTALPTEIETAAISVPLKCDAVLRVAELPTCQKTLQALASWISSILLRTPVVRVDGIWKINRLFELF
jgi:hypothetical protein